MRVRKLLWHYKPNKDGTCMVRIYAYHEGRKKYFHTGISVAPSDWDEKNSEVKKSHPLATRYNAKINGKKLEIEAHLLDGGTFEDMNAGNGSFLSYLEEFILQDNGLRSSSLRAYRNLRTRLTEYLKINGRTDITFNDFDKDFYQRYVGFLRENYCQPVGVGNHVKVIKKLLRKAEEEGLHRNQEYKKYKVFKGKGSNKIYLTEKEIKRLEALDLSNQPVLEQERDRFLLSYYFLLRFSDVIRINRTMFFEREGKKYLSIAHRKTGTNAVVPVNTKAAAILEKYDYDFSFTANQVANRKIKAVCALANINDQVTEGQRSGPKSQMVGTHTARRSAATNLCLQGVTLKFIADLGGWKETKILMLYLRQSGIDTAIMASDIEFFR